MNLWGKIIGCATGYALGNVEGAVLGMLAGHGVDVYTAWAESHVSSYAYAQKTVPSERRAGTSRYNFTLAIVTIAAKLAKADGPVTRTEINAFKEVFKIPPEETRAVGQMFDRARVSSRGFEPYATQLATMLADNKNTLDEVVSCLFHVALADGPMRPQEVQIIRRVISIFGFSESYYQRRSAEFTAEYDQSSSSSSGSSAQSLSTAYSILGVTTATTDKELKTRYRKLVRDNHPDTLMAQGKSKDQIAEATGRVARINAAYDQIAHERSLS